LQNNNDSNDITGVSTTETSYAEAEEEDIFTSLSKLGSLFWLISIMCFLLYGSFIPFTNISSAFLIENYFQSSTLTIEEIQKKAGLYMSIPFYICSIIVPIVGYLIDLIGQRAYLSLLTSIIGVLAFCMFYFLPPIWPLIMLGINYSLFVSIIWPAIAFVIDDKQIAFAYGLTFTFINVFQAIVHTVISFIYDSSKSYLNTLKLFISINIVSILISIVLIIIDTKRNSKLNLFKIFL